MSGERATGGSHTRSALGRVTLLVEVDGGTEKVTFERRCRDADEARAWCEQKLRDAALGASVVEIQVTEEVWGRRHAWEALANRHIPETLQLGLRSGAGTITWGATHPVGDEPGQRAR